MGFFDRFRKKRFVTDIAFEAVPAQECMTLESNRGLLRDPSLEELDAVFGNMLADASEFVTLTPAKAADGIRYLQACRVPGGIEVEAGLEKDGSIRLAGKVFDAESARQLFHDFYGGKAPACADGFEPVRFRK